MSDLIDRQAAIDALCERCRQDNPDTNACDICDDIEILKNIPSAQPCEKEAVWALHTYMPHSYYCTNCKQDSPYNKRWDFCPHCGFKMENYV